MMKRVLVLKTPEAYLQLGIHKLIFISFSLILARLLILSHYVMCLCHRQLKHGLIRTVLYNTFCLPCNCYFGI